MDGTGRKYEALFELAPDAIFITDLESGRITEVNDEAADLLGMSVPDLEGSPIARIHPADETDAYRQLLNKTVEVGEIRAERLDDGGQICIETADGRSVPVELHARAFELDGTDLVMTIARDISERLGRERELQRQNDHLGDLVQIMSHDIRNPLNVAMGRLELAADENTSEHIAQAQAALQRIENLIEDTLTLARQGETVTDIESIQLADYLDNCWQMVQSPDASIEIEVSESVSIRGDPSRLHQVFENLFRNSIEHSDGPVTIRVGTMPSGLFIEDDGPGIAEEAVEAVFESGYSGTNQGTGFGLAIVEEIVEAHGWSIEAVPSESGGARFEITDVELESV